MNNFSLAQTSVKHSVGHLAFIGTHEYYQSGDCVYASHASDPVMTDGRRCGRFECYITLWAAQAARLEAIFAPVAPVCGGSPEVAEVEAPVKAKPRTADSIILGLVGTLQEISDVNAWESIKDHTRASAEFRNGSAWRALSAAEKAKVSKHLKSIGRLERNSTMSVWEWVLEYLRELDSGSFVSFPEPVAQAEAPVEATAVEAGNASPIEGPFVDEANRVAKGLRTLVADKLPATCFEPHPHPWYNSYTITKMVQEQVKGVSFYTASLAVQEHFPMLFCPVEAAPVDPVTGDTAPLMGEAQAHLTGKTPPLVGDAAPTRKMTASDYEVNLDDIRKEGWDLRYFTIVERAIRDGALEVLASSDYGCSVHGPGRDTYGDTDDDEQVDFLAWLRIIRSPIRLTARNFSQAWDEFIVDCREGTPVGFPVPPIGDDDRDAMRAIFEETIHPDATENARWSESSSSRMTADSDGTSRCEIPTESYSGDRPRRATEDARLSIPSDTGSSVRRPPSGAATTDTRKTPSDATIDPEETLVDIPMEGDYGYCWGDDDTPLVGEMDDDRNDLGDFDPMTCTEYEAMIALGLAPICGGSPEYVQPEILPCPHCTSTNTVMDTEGFHDIVRCRGCGLRGPSATTGTDAACLWNRFARLAKDGPEQDDRLPCPRCHASGFVLEPDESDAPSTAATPEDATREPLDDAMTRDMDRLWRVLIRDHVTEEDLSDASLGLAAGATEIRRLRARVAELETENKRVGGLLQDAEDLLDSIDYERDDL